MGHSSSLYVVLLKGEAPGQQLTALREDRVVPQTHQEACQVPSSCFLLQLGLRAGLDLAPSDSTPQTATKQGLTIRVQAQYKSKQGS